MRDNRATKPEMTKIKKKDRDVEAAQYKNNIIEGRNIP